jgi:uncharacterized protein YrzB (UPF0473 family)
MIFSLNACGDNTENKISHEVSSNVYSQNDIDDAIKTITNEFDDEWTVKGCTLTEIYYAGDEVSSKYQSWAERNDADEVIVLLSSFDVDDSGRDGSFNANTTYDDWNWILVRTNGGQWIHIDHGY